MIKFSKLIGGTDKEVFENMKKSCCKEEGEELIVPICNKIPSNEEVRWVERETQWCKQQIKRLNDERMILESRRKKAIKYILKNSFVKEEFGRWFRVFKTDLNGFAQNLLDILEGNDNK